MTPAKLSRRVRRELDNPRNERWLSPASVVELFMLTNRGRVPLKEDVSTWLDGALEGLREATITFEIAREARNLPFELHDPVDRLIAASARVLDLRLVTADERMLGVGGLNVLDNNQ